MVLTPVEETAPRVRLSHWGCQEWEMLPTTESSRRQHPARPGSSPEPGPCGPKDVIKEVATGRAAG